jgi:hypothetical protein
VRFTGNWSNFTYALEDGFTDDNPTNTAGFDMQAAISGITPYDPVSGKFGGVMAYNEDPQAYNPYTLYINNLNRQNRQEANTNFYIDWSPIKGLTARLDYALNYYNQFRWAAPLPNRSYNFQTDSFGSRVYVGPNAGISNFTNTGYKTLLNGRLTYKKTIAKNHDITALVVYSEEYWKDRYQASSRNDRLYVAQTINVEVFFGTDLKNVFLQFSLVTDAKLTPKITGKVDFSDLANPKIFSVISGNRKVIKPYTVYITFQKP